MVGFVFLGKLFWQMVIYRMGGKNKKVPRMGTKEVRLMATCKRCGNSGRFLKVNEEGLCGLCASLIQNEIEERTQAEALALLKSSGIVVQCLLGNTLRSDGPSIVIDSKKACQSIPIANIQTFTLTLPKRFTNGKIIIGTAKAATSSVHLGYGVTASNGGEYTFVFEESELKNAQRLQEYVINYEKNRAAVPDATGKSVVSVVEEIRGLKSMLDEGILTQEEFDAKKKQLLEL